MKGEKMTDMSPFNLSREQLDILLNTVQTGVTLIDRDGRILYYNAFCARYADRKPEYIGRDIRLCHNHEKSIARIEQMLADLKSGRKKRCYYEAERNGIKIGVDVLPFFEPRQGEEVLTGFVQSFTVLNRTTEA